MVRGLATFAEGPLCSGYARMILAITDTLEKALWLPME